MLDFTVSFQKFDGKISAGNTFGQILIHFHDGIFDVFNALFQSLPIIDMDMADNGVLLFINLDDPVEQFFDAESAPAHCRDNGAADHAGQRFIVKLVPGIFQLVIHVQGNDHLHIHVNQLGCQVKVALQVGSIYHIDDNIRLDVLVQLLAHIQFFRCISRKGISAGQVYDSECVTILFKDAFFGIHCHSTIIPHVFMRTGSEVKEGSFAAIRIPDQCHIDGFPFMICNAA